MPASSRSVYLLGHRIAYSASPRLHEAAFRACGLPWRYEVLDVAAADLARAVDSVRTQEAAGANVTIPHKVTVMGMLDRVEPSAAEVGAVNTIVNRGGRLSGSNTDVAGVRMAMAEVGLETAPVAAAILGGGGAARAARAALGDARVSFVVRDPDKPRNLPGDLVAWPRSQAEWVSLLADRDVVINATPLGRRGEEVIPEAALSPRLAVIDLVYADGGTPLVRAAQARGLRAADGWLVLLAQGAASFEAWTGMKAPLDAMRAGLGTT